MVNQLISWPSVGYTYEISYDVIYWNYEDKRRLYLSEGDHTINHTGAVQGINIYNNTKLQTSNVKFAPRLHQFRKMFL